MRHDNQKEKRTKEENLTSTEIIERLRILYSKMITEYSREINGHDYDLADEYRAREELARKAINSGDFSGLLEASHGKRKPPKDLAELIIKRADNRRDKMNKFLIKLGDKRSVIRRLVNDGELVVAQRELEKLEKSIDDRKGQE